MEFLVNIVIGLPVNMDEQDRERLVSEERAAAKVFAEQGRLVRMWRVPGRRENWGLWTAQDATELHEIISSLPVWPWMEVTVHPLALHPVDPPAVQ